MKTIIIDDEVDARRVLRKYVERHLPDVQLVGEAKSVEEGIALILKFEPDFVFLDIKMSDGTGFDLIDTFPGKIPKIIFTTAYDQYAIKAFRYRAMDYLLKPVDPELMILAVQRIREELEANGESSDYLPENNVLDNKLLIPTQEGTQFLDLSEVFYIEADSSYCHIHLKDKSEILVSKPLKHFADRLLNNPNFLRTHKSFLINVNYVQALHKTAGGKIVLDSGVCIPISRAKKNEVQKILCSKLI
jgi:two-component system LytT family response regulator